MKIENEAATHERSTTSKAEDPKSQADDASVANNHESSKREKIVSVTEASSMSINSPEKSTTLATGGTPRGQQFSTQHSRIRSHVCFCNNAPSSSRCSTPQPHFRDIYCPKASQNFGRLKKTQSIFTDTKVSHENTSSVIIEEIPNEPCEKSGNKENQGKGKVNVDKETTRPRKHQNNSFPIFGGGDHNKPQKSYKSEDSKKVKSRPKSPSGNDSGVMIEEISNEECVEIRDRSKMKNEGKILEESGTIPKNVRASENGDRNKKIEAPEKGPEACEKNCVESNDNSSKFSRSLTTIEPRSVCTDVHRKVTEKCEGKFRLEENIEQQKKTLKVEKTVTFATDHEEIHGEACEICDKTIAEKNDCETVAGMRKIQLEKIESPYEFLRQWYSIRNDDQLIRRASLLKAMPPESIEQVMGNKLDGDMLSLILTCLEQHFCCAENSKVLNRFLQHLGKVKRFSIIRMFMDKKDEKALRNIFSFLDGQGMADQTQDLRKMYNVAV